MSPTSDKLLSNFYTREFRLNLNNFGVKSHSPAGDGPAPQFMLLL
ncbi:hypothetical protein [Biomaibacter acetigenes]|jgi:hypothetical protein|nr:hypothetical protein [Biomaibacter acetigenes]